VAQDALADALNRNCHCINVDSDRLQDALETRLGESGAWSRLQQTHPHLLAATPVFISRTHVSQMRAVVEAIERVVRLKPYQELVLGQVPEIARHDSGTHGVFFGYDFHLANDGPKLIEVNTNAGGALLLTHLASAQQACCEEVENFVTGRVNPGDLERIFIDMFREELRTQTPGKNLQRVAVVDDSPEDQYMRPEFKLFEQMFEHYGIDAIVAGPEAFRIEHGELRANGKAVDLVYNRLTDFYLESPACATLNEAYRQDAAAITPSPHTHALYANKQNLTVLCDTEQLRALDADEAAVKTLTGGIPRTRLVTADNADELWSRRKQLFFKPIWGFGSRGTYKGAKLTRKTWSSILEADYVSQEMVAPSERLVLVDGDEQALKLDVRCYSYKGDIQLLGARLYRGQTTNFRTDGGGLAAVFTTPGI